MFDDIIAIIIIGIILVLAIIYIVRSKKNGQKCIGCPHSKTCAAKRVSSCCSNKNNCSCCSSDKTSYLEEK